MTGIDDRAVDRAIDAALRRIPLPEHAPDFWERVAARLPASPGSNGHAGSMVSDGAAPREGPPPSPTPTPRSRRRRRPLGSPRRRLAVAIAAVVVLAAAGAVALARSPGGDRVETDPVDTPTTGGATTSTSTANTTVAGPRVPPGSEEAVLAFLDALGRGDLAAAASLLAPGSEASITATDRTVDDVLRQATEGYGTWAGARDRTSSTVVLDPGKVVVVVHGTVSLEGAVEERTEAFPVRYAESAETWLVEPWALDPAGGRLTLVTPDPGAGGSPPTFARIDEVVATAPASGTAWLAIDDQAPTATTVGTDLMATWSLAAPLPPGPHTLTVAFVNDTVFEATSAVYVVTS